MASEDGLSASKDNFSENIPRDNNLKAGEELSGLKRSFEGNSEYQPETKKIAMSADSNNVDMRKPAKVPILHQPQMQPPQQMPPQQQHPGQLQQQQMNMMGNPNSAPQGFVTEHILVPDRMVGLLIGKGGEQITSIQNECQCKVQFAPDAGGPQRQCMLSGPAAGVMKAKKIIDDVILKNQLISLGGDEVALEIMIPGNKVGLIIGKNGDTIKQLQERSGVKVAVIQDSTQPSDYEKPLRISGNKLGCQKAREMVMELLNEHDKGQNPGNARPGGMGGAMGGGAGGYHGGGGGSKHNIEIPVPRGLVGIVIGKGGEMIKKIQEESGAKVQFRPDDIDDNGPNRICHVYGHKQSNDIAVNLIHDLIKTGMNRQNGGGMGGGGGGGGVPFATPFGSAPFPNGVIHPIPTDKCGLVIGKGGENIKEINRISGAHAELVRDQNNANADPNTKRFRIQGTPEQVQHCIQLINEKAGLVTGPPMVGGPVFGGLQGGPPMMSPYAPLNMQGPPGALVTPFPAQAQVLVPNQQMYSAPVPQAQYVSAAPAQPAGATYAPQPTPQAPGGVPYGQPQQPQQPPQQQQQPAAVYVDPTKSGDPNAAAWAAYYAQLYGGQQQPAAGMQQAAAAGQQAAVPQVQAIQAAPAGHTQVAYATTQVLAAAAPVPAAATAQPQPTINPQTGQPDYSLAWAEYYRAQGLHHQAAAVMQAAGMPQAQ